MTVRRALFCGLLPVLTACASGESVPGGSTASTERNTIATVHANKCGSCHTLPAPKTRTREHLEDAFSRHKKRVRLTREEWATMIDYLAMPEGNTARQP